MAIKLQRLQRRRCRAKGEQFRLELAQGEYQLIAWVDVNGNGVVDTSDYYTETELIEFGYGEGWSWWGVLPKWVT